MSAGREWSRPAILAAIACAAGMSAGPTPMVSAVASLFMKPLAAEFGLSRTAISAILLMSPLAVAAFAPAGGQLIDRYGVRRVLLPTVLAFAAANGAMMLVGALWQYLLLALVISGCIAIHCYSSYTKVLSRWFTRRRGIVTGVAIAGGSGLGAALIPQLVQPWIETHGWRYAYGGMAVIILCWAFPMLLLLLREPRDHMAQVAASTEGVGRAEAMRMPVFWLIAAAMACAPFAIIGTVGHLFPLLTERGVSPARAATALSFIYVGGMIGQLSAGYLLDRVASPRVVLVFFVAALTGIGIVHGGASGATLLAGAALTGLGQGAEMSILAYLTSRYFGLAHYGAIYGRLYGIANLGIAGGLLSMGAAHDRWGSYAPMAWVIGGAIVAAVILFSRLPPYRFALHAIPLAQDPAQP